MSEGDAAKRVKSGLDRAGFVVVGANNRQLAISEADRIESELIIEIRPPEGPEEHHPTI